MGERSMDWQLDGHSGLLKGCSGARTVRPNGGARHVNRVLLGEWALCGADMIAPQWSEHVSDHCVRNGWLCEACGREFEDTVYLSAHALTW